MKGQDLKSMPFEYRTKVARRNIRVVSFAGMTLVVSSAFYDLAFTIFGVVHGASISEAFRSQFSIQSWLTFWSALAGAVITIVYISIIGASVVFIFWPQLWTGNYANIHEE